MSELRRVVLSLVLLALASPLAGVEVSFVLVPEKAWSTVDIREATSLRSGEIRLYRSGTERPEMTLEPGTPVSVPPGTWHWLASAPGYVSVRSGTLHIGDPEGAESKRIAWPVVPACRRLFSGRVDRRGVQRVDVVSLPRQAVFPLRPDRRQGMWVPVGEAIAYSVGPRGLIGMERLSPCDQHEERELPSLGPPSRLKQDLLVRLRLPEEGGQIDLSELIVMLRRADGAAEVPKPRLPDGRVWIGDTGSFFFTDLTAVVDLELVVRHPKLRTVMRRIEPAGGSARELPAVKLRRRLDLSLEIDYQPARVHERESLELRFCGRQRRPARLGSGVCSELVRETPLRRGRARYRFDNVDTGRYIVNAQVDGEAVHGLGHGVFPYLGPEAESPPTFDAVPLVEHEIWGHLLRDGEAVAGEVRLLPSVPDRPMRRFPTDEELIYRLFYFGVRPFAQYSLEEGETRDPEEVLGLYWFYRLSACGPLGACRLFHQDSVLRGSGRLDLELSSGRQLAIRVVEAVSGEPVPGARVHLSLPRTVLRFDNGEVSTGEAEAGTGALLTGPDGRMVVQPAPEGEIRYSARREGYETVRDGRFRIVADEQEAHLRIPLVEKRSGEPGGVAFRFPSGAPVERAFLLAFDEQGRWSHCSTRTDGEGVAELKSPCPEEGRVALLHPAAAITLLDASRLRTAAEIEVDRAPQPPLNLRVVDAEGRPVAGASIELRYGEVVIDESALIAAAGASVSLFRRTDEAGELWLRGVDLQAVEVPEVALAGAPEDAGVPLSAYRPGETVVLRAPAE